MIDEKATQTIEHLHRMKAQGIISEEEFEQSKQRILFGGRETSTASSPASTEIPIDGQVRWATLPFRRYADFRGRSGRREFWSFALLLTLVSAVLAMIASADANIYGGVDPIGQLALILFVVGFTGCFVPLLAVQVRRLHDQDRSGWLVLLNLIPYLGGVIMLVLMALEGTRGPNRHGPDPNA